MRVADLANSSVAEITGASLAAAIDDPKFWGLPPPRLQWEVYPVDKKGRVCGSSVYVCAENRERALACGKYWRRVLSMKPAKNLVVKRYYPQNDPALEGWVVRTPNSVGDKPRCQ